MFLALSLGDGLACKGGIPFGFECPFLLFPFVFVFSSLVSRCIFGRLFASFLLFYTVSRLLLTYFGLGGSI